MVPSCVLFSFFFLKKDKVDKVGQLGKRTFNFCFAYLALPVSVVLI